MDGVEIMSKSSVVKQLESMLFNYVIRTSGVFLTVFLEGHNSKFKPLTLTLYWGWWGRCKRRKEWREGGDKSAGMGNEAMNHEVPL